MACGVGGRLGAASRALLTAAGAALGAAAPVLLIFALREQSTARAAFLAAAGASLLVLAALALGAAALAWIEVRVGACTPHSDAARTPPAAAPGAVPKILDTNVIIDGRIADVAETGLLEGTLVVPQFVLGELQYIADSADPIKRNRGRRGLDILARMQKRPELTIVVSERDFPLVREVDAKLVALARETGGRIVTNDFNLAKVAGVSGVPVLNLNLLTTALKPVALPGEPMRVTVVKEGKEPNQGVAYLDDGTMVVVDNGRRHVGGTLEVTVTSAIQTTAGRMIFAQPREGTPGAGEAGA